MVKGKLGEEEEEGEKGEDEVGGKGGKGGGGGRINYIGICIELYIRAVTGEESSTVSSPTLLISSRSCFQIVSPFELIDWSSLIKYTFISSEHLIVFTYASMYTHLTDTPSS